MLLVTIHAHVIAEKHLCEVRNIKSRIVIQIPKYNNQPGCIQGTKITPHHKLRAAVLPMMALS